MSRLNKIKSILLSAPWQKIIFIVGAGFTFGVFLGLIDVERNKWFEVVAYSITGIVISFPFISISEYFLSQTVNYTRVITADRANDVFDQYFVPGYYDINDKTDRKQGFGEFSGIKTARDLSIDDENEEIIIDKATWPVERMSDHYSDLDYISQKMQAIRLRGKLLGIAERGHERAIDATIDQEVAEAETIETMANYDREKRTQYPDVIEEIEEEARGNIKDKINGDDGESLDNIDSSDGIENTDTDGGENDE